jgi:hypothetical protein
MDKSFNDQELSDIMKEIEALEEEFTAEDDLKAQSAEVMEEVVEMEEEKAIPLELKHSSEVLAFEPKQAPTKSTKSSAPAAMSFKVQGEMNLELQFEIGAKTIQLEVTESGLSIKMEGGMTFTVPVQEPNSFKKAI